MSRKALILLLLVNIGLASGQDLLNRNISVHVEDMRVRNILDQISENNDVYFTYAGNLEAMNKRLSLNIDNVSLNKLLNDIFFGEDIIFSSYSNQVVLKKKPEVIRKYFIRGVVLESGSENPVEFTSIQFRKSGKGLVSGFDGKFEVTACSEDLGDSLSFYRVGYEMKTYSLRFLTSLETHKIFLNLRDIKLDSVILSARKPELLTEGNRGLAFGSLYLDTHGQQVALLIPNRKNVSGRLSKVSVYLSGKGNTEAPFRVRIYSLNDSLDCPGIELLPDILIVKPGEGRGWYDIDLKTYNIRFSQKGIFVAIEGVYPGDYVRYAKSNSANNGDTGDEETDVMEESLDYGQRLGYNRFSKNQTWHYSLSNTWFQLKKKYFNVMISAEIMVYDPHKLKNQKP